MKANRLVFPEKMKVGVESFDLPDQPGEREVLLENVASLVSPGTELAMFTASHMGFKVGDTSFATFPFLPGYAAVGKVVAKGAQVKSCTEGDLVLHLGHHASHAVTSDNSIYKLPKGVCVEEATFGVLAAVALAAIRYSSVRLGDSAAVFGQGLVGNLAAQLLQIAGARVVYALDTLPERLALSRACGLLRTIDPASEDPPRDCRIVVEATGHPATLPQALKAVAAQGDVLLLGSPTGRVDFDPYHDVHRPGIRMIGAHARHLYTYTRPGDLDPEALMLEYIAQKRLQVRPLITHRLPASRAEAAYRGLIDDKRSYCGVVLDLTSWN